MEYIKRISVLCFLFIAWANYAQGGKVREADAKFDDLAYADAIEIYESVAEKGFVDQEMLEKLGDAYYFNGEYVAAAKWYRQLFDVSSNLTPEYKFRYGQSLKAIGSYEEADKQLRGFYESQGLHNTSSSDYLKTIEESSDKYLVNSVGYNTQNSDYPGFLQDGMLYVISGSNSGENNPWNNEPTSDIFKLNGGSLKSIGDEINTKFNEGSLAITKDGNTLFFTRNDFNKDKLGTDKNKTTRLKLYRAKKVNGEWSNVEELPFNSSEYSIGHPALSPDEKTLYFVSDMPNGQNRGGTDIYEVSVLSDGGFGPVRNMTEINTAGDEMFPFVADDNTFYFASNGQVVNLGGLDVYSAVPNDSNGYKEVSNIGRPINSAMDDFALVVDNDSANGYFATNRTGTKSDDLFSFTENPAYSAPCDATFRGVVRDQETNDILENVLVSLVGANNEIINQKTAPAGLYEFPEGDCNKAKFVRAEKSGYQTAEELLADPKDGISTTDILLSKREIDISPGTDLGKILNPIYFDLGKAKIRRDAQLELQKIVAIMKDNPTIKVDVRSHTDSRADDAFNLRLSDRRVRSTIDYLVKSGIDRSRLTGRGYGESQLINECSNGVSCSEAAHQQNRRSEFIIVSQ